MGMTLSFKIKKAKFSDFSKNVNNLHLLLKYMAVKRQV